MRYPKKLCQSRRNSVMFRKNPLNNFKKSIKKKAIRDTLQKSNEQSAINSFGRNSSLHDTTIVINDSDNETTDGNSTDSSLSIIEYNCDSRTSTPLSSVVNLKKRTLRSYCRQKIRSPLSLVNENGSSRIPDDDVVELWSYLGNSSKAEKKNVSKQPKHNQKVDNIFKVDRKIDCSKHLNLNTKPVRTKRRGGHNSKKAIMLEPLNFVQTAKRRSINANSNLRHINTESSKHKIKIKKDERSKLGELPNSKHKLREIIVDGCNVAMSYTNDKAFSEKGISLVIDYFESKGHTVKVFLPQYIRKKNYQLLEKWYSKGTVVFTPSRCIAGKRITPYEDRYILEYATKCNGIVISSDQYRDLYKEKPEWRDTIQNRLLMPTFVGDYIMFPEDPLGKSGPDLQTFLRH